MAQISAMNKDRHKILPLEAPMERLQASNISPMFLDSSQLQPKLPSTEFQTSKATFQLSNKWKLTLQLKRHEGYALTTITFDLRRLFKVRILPWGPNQLKARALGGALEFQMEPHFPARHGLKDKDEKKESTENTPSWEQIQPLLSMLHLGCRSNSVQKGGELAFLCIQQIPSEYWSPKNLVRIFFYVTSDLC